MPDNPQIVMRSVQSLAQLSILTKEETYLGRDLSNDIPVPDPEISRRHARFYFVPREFSLKTWVQQMVHSSMAYALVPHRYWRMAI